MIKAIRKEFKSIIKMYEGNKDAFDQCTVKLYDASSDIGNNEILEKLFGGDAIWCCFGDRCFHEFESFKEDLAENCPTIKMEFDNSDSRFHFRSGDFDLFRVLSDIYDEPYYFEYMDIFSAMIDINKDLGYKDFVKLTRYSLNEEYIHFEDCLKDLLGFLKDFKESYVIPTLKAYSILETRKKCFYKYFLSDMYYNNDIDMDLFNSLDLKKETLPDSILDSPSFESEDFKAYNNKYVVLDHKLFKIKELV